jgi:hypothetical protein
MVKVTLLAAFALVTFTACAGKDEVMLSSLTGSDPPTLVLNGRRSGCIPYEVAHGAPVFVDNLLSAGSCVSEIAVFARSNAMSLVNTVGKWTDLAGDVVAVSMRAPYVVPINIFVMSGDLLQHSVPVRQAEAVGDVSRATQLYDDDQCGITFSITVNEDVSRYRTFGAGQLTADCTGNVASFKAIDPDRTAVSGVNVFYQEGFYGNLGHTCSDGNSALIVISKWSGNEVLAHELGHALSLVHPNDPPGIPGMPPTDLMMSPASAPGRLTAGQCFRANGNASSVLNSLPIRSGPTRSCPDSWTGPDCPPLTTHR